MEKRQSRVPTSPKVMQLHESTEVLGHEFRESTLSGTLEDSSVLSALGVS